MDKEDFIKVAMVLLQSLIDEHGTKDIKELMTMQGVDEADMDSVLSTINSISARD